MSGKSVAPTRSQLLAAAGAVGEALAKDDALALKRAAAELLECLDDLGVLSGGSQVERVSNGEALEAGLTLKRTQQGRHDKYLPTGTALVKLENGERLMHRSEPLGPDEEWDVVLSVETKRAGQTLQSLSVLLYRAEAEPKFAAAYEAITGRSPDEPWWVQPLETMLEKRSFRDAESRLTPRPAPSVDPATAAEMLSELERIRADHAQLGFPLAAAPLTEQDIAGLMAEVGGRGGRKARTVVAAKLKSTK